MANKSERESRHRHYVSLFPLHCQDHYYKMAF